MWNTWNFHILLVEIYIDTTTLEICLTESSTAKHNHSL